MLRVQALACCWQSNLKLELWTVEGKSQGREMVKHNAPCFTIFLCSPAPLGVVLLSVYVSAGAVLPSLNPGPLSRSDLAVSFGPRLNAVSPCLLPFHPRGFPSRQTAATDALPNAFLLATLPVVNAWRASLRARRDAHAEQERC